MITLFQIVLISLAAFFPMSWVVPTLAVGMVGLSLLFYQLCYKLLVGVNTSAINSELDVPMVWTGQIANIASVGVLVASGGLYQAAAMFVAPWVLINLVVNAVSTLIKWGYLEFQDRDE